MLEAPAVFHELGREPIEQRWMRRGIALHAELARRADDAFTEMVMPQAIDDHARGEGIVGIGQEFCQRCATPAVLDLCWRGINDLHETGRNFLALLIED